MTLASRFDILRRSRVTDSLEDAAEDLLKRSDRTLGAIADVVGAAPGDDLVAAVKSLADERDFLRAGFTFLGYDHKTDIQTWVKAAKQTLAGESDGASSLQADHSAWLLTPYGRRGDTYYPLPDHWHPETGEPLT